MCTITLNVNERLLRKANPALADKESITRWAQSLLGRCTAYMEEDTEAQQHLLKQQEEMRVVVAERLHQMETGQAVYVDGEEGFSQIRTRYGL